MWTIEEQNFDKYVRSQGGRLDMRSLDSPFGTAFERLRAGIISYLSRRKEEPVFAGTNFQVHFDFVNNPFINALAFCVDGTYHVGLFSGTVLYLNYFMLKLLSDHRIFPNVGDAGKENRTIVDFDNEIPASSDLFLEGIKESDSVPFAAFPNDRTRAFFAMYIAELASYFIFLHELAHILFGHLTYLYGHTNTKEIREIGPDYLGTISTKTLQALELDADTSAITAFFSIADSASISSSGRKSKELSFLWDSEDNPYWASAIAINIIFRLFDSVGTLSDGHEYSTHPHPQIRFAFALGWATDFYETNRLKELKGFRSGWARANEECYMIWQLLRIPHGSIDSESTRNTAMYSLSAELVRLRKQLIPLF